MFELEFEIFEFEFTMGMATQHRWGRRLSMPKIASPQFETPTRVRVKLRIRVTTSRVRVRVLGLEVLGLEVLSTFSGIGHIDGDGDSVCLQW